MDTPIREVKSNEAMIADWNVAADTKEVTQRTPQLTHRQRQVEEIYELYDFLMLDSLLKRHPTPEEHTGS